MWPSGSAHQDRAPPAMITNHVGRRPGRRQGRAEGRPFRGLPGRDNDAVHAPLSTCHHEWRCVRRSTLWTKQSAAVTRHLNPRGRHTSRCLQVIVGGASPPLSNSSFQRDARSDGGDRWVAHTGIGGHGRISHLRRSSGRGWPGHRCWVVVTLTRGGQGRGAAISSDRSATSCSHRARSSSWCRRIHSASTIAAASSSRLVAQRVLVTIAVTPFPECCARPSGEVGRR